MTERVAPDQVRTVACVGAGVIGGGWVAYFLARGFAVRAWDPAPDAEARLRGLVDAAWPALTELGLSPGAGVRIQQGVHPHSLPLSQMERESHYPFHVSAHERALREHASQHEREDYGEPAVD